MKSIAWRAVTLTAAVYFYFLIFAQFGFLKLLESSPHASTLKVTMGAMGLAGMLGSLLTPLLLKKCSWGILLILGFAGCSLAAISTLAPLPVLLWPTVAAAIGFSLGIVTVTLVSHLPSLIGDDHWGLTIGLGTGLAYFACNVPWVFQASAIRQTIAAATVALIGCCTVPFRREAATAPPQPSNAAALHFGWALLIFTMLIWLDSAAFFIIQNNRTLIEGTWGGTGMLWRNALVHLSSALVAGWWLERQRSLTPAALAFVVLAVAAYLVNIQDTLWLGGALYPIGVSLYSTCLVAFPAYLLSNTSCESRISLTAVLYAVAGWIGSGMGIGMAENLQSVPGLFIVTASALVTTAFGWPLLRHRRREIGICAALLSIAFGLSSMRSITSFDSNTVDQGREVYIAEGCIHCHSRYVRPQPKETLMWGPYVSYEEALKERPPLFGNRRQGPDLLNVGLRRSRAWLKAHFINPRALAPDSVMPNYSHLFSDDRGEALLDYLVEPHGPFEERYRTIQAWQLPPETPAGDTQHQWSLYKKHCMVCHGESGQSKGSIGQLLSRPPANLRKGPFIHSVHKADIPRIIKFGVFGTDMPGHEYLSDEDIAALTDYVNSLRTSS